MSLDVVSSEASMEDIYRALDDPEVLADIGKYLANVAVPTSSSATKVTVRAIGGYAHIHRDVEESGSCGMCKALASRNVTNPFIIT